MNNEKGDSYRIVKTRECFTDISSDYVLPDYLGEVRKILFTEACVIPLPVYMNGDVACASGSVLFKMVYTDSEGALSTAEFSADYDIGETCDAGYAAIGDETEIDGYSMRLLGPRKISAKARVSSKLMLVKEENCELYGSALLSPGVELATKRVLAREAISKEPTEREYAEEILFLEGKISDEVEVPYYTSESFVMDCHAIDEEIMLSGEHRISAAVKCQEEPVYIINKTIPFAERISFEDAREGMYATALARVSSLKISENPTDTGTSLTASLIAEYTPLCEGNQDVSLAVDGYMTDREVKAEYTTFETEEFLLGEAESERAEFSVEKSALGLDGTDEILYVLADAKIKNVDIYEKSMKITSEIKFSGIACELNEDMTRAYVPLKHSCEVVKNVSFGCQNYECLRPELSISALSSEGFVDGESIKLETSLLYNIKLYEKKNYKVLSRLDATDEMYEKKKINKIYVYYPDTEDTLFSVARKFHTSTEKVAKDNSLTESAISDMNSRGSLAGVTKLIIK